MKRREQYTARSHLSALWAWGHGLLPIRVKVWKQSTVARSPKPGERYSAPHRVAASSCRACSRSRSLFCTTPSWAGALGPHASSLLFRSPGRVGLSQGAAPPSGGISKCPFCHKDRKGSPTEAELVGSLVSARAPATRDSPPEHPLYPH